MIISFHGVTCLHVASLMIRLGQKLLHAGFVITCSGEGRKSQDDTVTKDDDNITVICKIA